MLVNTVGYYASLLWMASATKQYVSEKISAAADDMGGSLIIKMPLSLPYPIRTEEYEAADGKIAFNGKSYQMIKQRLYRDTLYVVCVVDPEQSMVNGKVKEYTDAMAEAGQDQSKGMQLIASPAKFCPTPWHAIQVQEKGWVRVNNFGESASLYRFALPLSLLRPPTWFGLA